MWLKRRKVVNLALQGGGAHGAFTWGVLDRLLEDALALSRIFSPYQLNPMNLDPLRDIVTSVFDFEQLREQSKLKLFIAATQVSTGKLRLFKTHEMTPEALLASACLPTLHHAVMIDGEAYWDGGYAGNPVLFPLFYECNAPDIAVILLHPLDRPQLPTSVSSIQQRTAELTFGATFLREMRSIVQARQHVGGNYLSIGKLERRLRRLNLHMIEPDQALTKLDGASKLDNDSGFLQWLKDRGRETAEIWLEQNFGKLGRRSSIDLEALFG